MAASSDSNISGDKGDNSEGLDDYWIFKTTDAILGISQNMPVPSLAMYPNPSNGNFTIKMDKVFENISVEITNMLGQRIAFESYRDTQTLDLSTTASAGIYFVTITADNFNSLTKKIIIK